MGALRNGVLRGLAIALVSLLLQVPATAQPVTGRVIAIADGDTLTVLTEAKQQMHIRLAEIDTPEAAQPYGTRARQELSKLTFGKDVQVTVQDIDRYGRTVGRVRTGGQDVNAEMIRLGAAWVYRKYNRDVTLLAVEAEARAARRGLWALPEAERVPPWEWRVAGAPGREERGQTAQVVLPAILSPPVPLSRANAGGFMCGTKRVCREMGSCAEARFHLVQCGMSQLDRDHDGVPCESICR